MKYILTVKETKAGKYHYQVIDDDNNDYGCNTPLGPQSLDPEKRFFNPK